MQALDFRSTGSFGLASVRMCEAGLVLFIAWTIKSHSSPFDFEIDHISVFRLALKFYRYEESRSK
ncbi:MAG: hypothetical protein ACJ71J_14455 [Nitrososphaeraceae archaeon]